MKGLRGVPSQTPGLMRPTMHMIRFEDRFEPLISTPGIAGVDEAGRGPLAGPVVVAAVVLPDSFDVRGLRDSKKMSKGQRQEQAARIRASARVVTEVISHQEIDKLNILGATMEGMRRCMLAIAPFCEEALMDGNRVPGELPRRATPIVKGDGLYASIAAASIIAKETRDEIMIQYSVQYPRYGFHKHFGYPTAEHLNALKVYGPCAIHRRTFAPVQQMVEQACLVLES